MSNEIKKYDEYIFKDGEYRQVAGAQGAGRRSSKYITLSKRLQSFYYEPEDQDYNFQILRLTLIGFNNADIGRKIFLYKVKTKQPGYLTHPRDCFDSTHTNVAQLGCGTFWNPDDEEYVYNSTYQTNQGLVQTEWVLTSQDIERGYFEINLSEWVVNLFFPSQGSNWQQCKFIGGKYFWFALENDIKTISEQMTLYKPSTGNNDFVWLDSTDQLLYLNNKYYFISAYWNHNDRWGNPLYSNSIGIRID